MYTSHVLKGALSLMEMEKPIRWVGSSLDDLHAFPVGAKKDAGYQLHRIQQGLDPEDWKPFASVGPGVKEIRISVARGIYRVMYVAKFKGAVYVLHAFQKKTQRTPRKELEIARARYNAIAG